MAGMMPGMNKPPMGADPLAEQQSMLNPTDLTMMAQEGNFSKEMTIGDFLGKLGMSPDDPVQKLFEFGKKQVQNASPMNKAKNMARNMGNQPTQPPAGQGEEMGLDSLLQGM